MNAKQGAALALIVCLIVVALAASAFLSSSARQRHVYRAGFGGTRVAGRDRERRDDRTAVKQHQRCVKSRDCYAWIEFNNGDYGNGVYNFSLTPPPASRYLVANVTVTNVHHTEIPFDYGDFVLIAHDGTAYYANYAVCNTGCSAQALENRALNETFSSDMYVLFSVPAATQPVQIAYTGATPPL